MNFLVAIIILLRFLHRDMYIEGEGEVRGGEQKWEVQWDDRISSIDIMILHCTFVRVTYLTVLNNRFQYIIKWRDQFYNKIFYNLFLKTLNYTIYIILIQKQNIFNCYNEEGSNNEMKIKNLTNVMILKCIRKVISFFMTKNLYYLQSRFLFCRLQFEGDRLLS